MSELLSNDELLDFLSIGEDDSRYHAVNQLLNHAAAQDELLKECENVGWIKTRCHPPSCQCEPCELFNKLQERKK